MSVDEIIEDAIYHRLVFGMIADKVIRENHNVGQWTPRNRQVIVSQDFPKRYPEIDCPGNPPALGFQTTITLSCHVCQSELDPTPTNRLLSEFATEVITWVTSSDDWPRWGIAIDSNVGDFERSSVDDVTDAVQIPITVSYRVSENNFTEARA